jgi:hypothetical protein
MGGPDPDQDQLNDDGQNGDGPNNDDPLHA